MVTKKPVKKQPTKKEIEEAAASVEEAIAKLEVEEVDTEETEEIVGEETPTDVSPDSESNVEESGTPDVPEEVTHKPQKEEVEEVTDQAELPKEEEPSSISDAGTVFSRTSFEEEKSGGGKAKVIITICLIIIFTIFGFIGGYFYGKSEGVSTAVPTPTETVPTFTPTPTEAGEVDLSAYSIEILNGSGVAGVAGDEQESLETDGFSVENTGNAENQDFTETVIAVKPDVPKEFIDKLSDSLSERYVLAEDTEELEDDNDYDVVITIGSETVEDE